MSAEIGTGLRQHLALDDDVALGHLEAGERPAVVEARERQGPGPRQSAAQRAVAAAQLDRDEVVLAVGEPRAGKAQQNAAGLDPARQLLARVGADLGAVGEHDLGHAGCQQFGQRAAPQFGVRRQSLLDIVELRQKRLRCLRRRLADQPHQPLAPAFVEQDHAADAHRRLQLEPGDLIAQLDRQVDPDLPARGPVLELQGLASQNLAGRADRAQDQALRAARSLAGGR